MSTRPRVLIVGSRGKLGTALCRQLSTDRDVVGLDFGEIPTESVDEHGVLHLLCDLRSESSLREVLRGRVGDFHGLVYLPRIKNRHRFPDVESGNLIEEISLTVGGLISILQVLVPRDPMEPRRLESIVVLSSALASRVSTLEGLGYHVSKAALEQLVRVLAFDLSPLGVRINALRPTWVERGEGNEQGRSAKVTSALELIHNGSVFPRYEDVGNVIKFLLGSQSKAMSGSTLEVDRGVQNLESLYVALGAYEEEWNHA